MPKSFAWIGVFPENRVGASSAPHGLMAAISLVTILTAWLGEVEKPPREEDRGQILVAEGSEHIRRSLATVPVLKKRSRNCGKQSYVTYLIL